MDQNKKYFIITVDTEGDDQWNVDNGISTVNATFIPRFQELCEKYNFKPVWLTNYEMANDQYYVSYIKPKQEQGLCEVGMHLHAWYTPPEFSIKNKTDQRDYLIEYPEDIMEKKIMTMTNLIEDRFGIKPRTHRSGRWAMDERYFRLIEKYGYYVDCSVTPGIDWSKCVGKSGIPGSDYSGSSTTPHYVGRILEVPMTIRKMHIIDSGKINSFREFAKEVKRFIRGRNQWIRPDKQLSFSAIGKLMERLNKEGENYIMFMIHSSELMPGGSPNFPDEKSIEKLYGIIEKIFTTAKKLGYVGITLTEYYQGYKMGCCSCTKN